MSARESQAEPQIDRLEREAFINLFLAADRFSDEVEAICKADGLTMSHYTVLWVVCLLPSPDGVPMRAIADGVLTRAADATRLVDRLTKDGYVQRRHSDGLARQVGDRKHAGVEEGLRDRLLVALLELAPLGQVALSQVVGKDLVDEDPVDGEAEEREVGVGALRFGDDDPLGVQHQADRRAGATRGACRSEVSPP